MLFLIVFCLVIIAICLRVMDWQFFWDVFKWGLLVVVALFILGTLLLLGCFLFALLLGKTLLG